MRVVAHNPCPKLSKVLGAKLAGFKFWRPTESGHGRHRPGGDLQLLLLLPTAAGLRIRWRLGVEGKRSGGRRWQIEAGQLLFHLHILLALPKEEKWTENKGNHKNRAPKDLGKFWAPQGNRRQSPPQAKHQDHIVREDPGPFVGQTLTDMSSL